MQVNHLEVKRQILHILIGIIILFSIIFNIITPLWMFILLALSGFLAVLSLKYKIPFVNFLLRNFERNNPDLPGKGFIMFLVGILLAWRLFPENIALASIVILTFADPISHFIGESFGRTKSFLDKKKNIEGHLAGIIISSLLAMFFVSPLLALTGSLAAMLFESIIIEIQKIRLDDNLIIPLVAGTAMMLMSLII